MANNQSIMDARNKSEMSEEKPLPLLRLPYVVLVEILKEMGFHRVLNLSFCSEKARKHVMSCRLVISGEIYLNNRIECWIDPEMDLSTVLCFYKEEVKVWERKKMLGNYERRSSGSVLRGKKRGARQKGQRCQHWFRTRRKCERYQIRGYTMPPTKLPAPKVVYVKDIAEDHESAWKKETLPKYDFTTLIKHIASVFKFSDITLFLEEVSPYFSMEAIHSAFSEISIKTFHISSDCQPIVGRAAIKRFAPFEDITFASNPFKCNDDYHEFLKNHSHQFTLSQINNPRLRTTLADLYFCNALKIEVLGTLLTDKDLNTFIKKWIEGSNPSMAVFSNDRAFITNKKVMNEEQVMADLKYRKSQKTLKSFGIHYSKNYKNYDIWRNDGTVATIFIWKHFLTMHVWTEDPNKTIQHPNNKSNVVVCSVTVNVDGSLIKAFDVSEPTHFLKKIAIKERSVYNVKICYHVQRQIAFGFQYTEVVHKGTAHEKETKVMMSKYVPRSEMQEFSTPLKRFPIEATDTATHAIHSRIIDYENNVYLDWYCEFYIAN